MNRTSIAAITSVLILILIGCGGKSTNATESPGSEVSKTNVNIGSENAIPGETAEIASPLADNPQVKTELSEEEKNNLKK